MTRIEIQVSEGVLASLHLAPEQFSQELPLAAAIKWYEAGRLSQARAAEIAGISRAEFIEALARFQVTPFQVRGDELICEALHD